MRNRPGIVFINYFVYDDNEATVRMLLVAVGRDLLTGIGKNNDRVGFRPFPQLLFCFRSVSKNYQLFGIGADAAETSQIERSRQLEAIPAFSKGRFAKACTGKNKFWKTVFSKNICLNCPIL